MIIMIYLKQQNNYGCISFMRESLSGLGESFRMGQACLSRTKRGKGKEERGKGKGERGKGKGERGKGKEERKKI